MKDTLYRTLSCQLTRGPCLHLKQLDHAKLLTRSSSARLSHHRQQAVHTQASEPKRVQAPAYKRRGIPIHPGEVHLWWLDPSKVQSPRLLQQYLNVLTPAELEFVAQGSSESVRKERLLARTLVRTVLSRYCHGDISPKQLKFDSNVTGKPYLVSGESYDPQQGQLHFNLTHTSSLLGLAVARGVLVGLDVEDSTRRTRSSPAKLAKKRFSAQEYAALEGFAENPREQATLFIRLWTLKEAYVKAQGLGIAASPGLKSFAFEIVLSNRVKRYEAKELGLPIEDPPAQDRASASQAPEETPPTDLASPLLPKEEGSVAASSFSSGSYPSAEPSHGYEGFNLNFQTGSFPMTSGGDSSYRRGGSGGFSPWRDQSFALSAGSNRNNIFAWGTEHTAQSSPREQAPKTAEPVPELQLPIFWSFRDRTPFRIQFQQSEDDSRRWAVWLMESQGGHTSALLVETDQQFEGQDNDRVEKQLRLRAFNTVPLLSEEIIHQSRSCRVIGFGISA